MQPPELPPGVTVPELYELADRAHKQGTIEVMCNHCGEKVSLDECIISYEVNSGLETFLRQIAEFYDQRR